MKTKRITTVLMFACAMLFATHTAQAFYNPSIGRWLSRDPIGENDSPNISSFLRNEGLNSIDLLGLATLEFKVVVGTSIYPGPWGAGKWSDPGWAGSGWYNVGGNWAFAYVDLYNGPSPKWPQFGGNYCNTVDWIDPIANGFRDAGSILILLSDCDGGKFRVSGTYTVKVGGEGPGQSSPKGAIYATATLYKGFGPVKHTLMQTQATKDRPVVRKERHFSIDVELKKGERKVVLTHDVVLQFPNPIGNQPSFGMAEGSFDDVTVEAVK